MSRAILDENRYTATSAKPRTRRLTQHASTYTDKKARARVASTTLRYEHGAAQYWGGRIRRGSCCCKWLKMMKSIIELFNLISREKNVFGYSAHPIGTSSA
eukprot:4459657-Pleurochrysis_carterae.AAC.1